jgi:hypothetical protein
MDGSSIWGAGLSHHVALLVAYLITLLAWDRIAHRRRDLWPAAGAPELARPWVELAYFGVALVLVLGLGQLYTRHWLIPARGAVRPFVDALNQFVIFSPILALPLVRRQGFASAWLPVDRVWQRILFGLILSLIATLAYTSVRSGAEPWMDVLRDVYHPKNSGSLAQVLCEDIAVAILFVRTRAAIGAVGATLAVSALFAAGHIPAMLAGSAGLTEITGLVGDAGLAVVVLYALQRSNDVWWFWLVHFAMDMMQFYAVSS